jgi:hypothetical protein
MTLVHILYSGLGGHFSVIFSLINGDKLREFNYFLIFFGIEEMPQSYIDKCVELDIKYYFVKKAIGIDLASQKKIIRILNDNPGNYYSSYYWANIAGFHLL